MTTPTQYDYLEALRAYETGDLDTEHLLAHLTEVASTSQAAITTLANACKSMPQTFEDGTPREVALRILVAQMRDFAEMVIATALSQGLAGLLAQHMTDGGNSEPSPQMDSLSL